MKREVKVMVTLSRDEDRMLERLMDDGLEETKSGAFRALLIAEFRRAQAARAARKPEAVVVHELDAIVIDGVRFSKDEVLTSLDDRVRK